MGRRRGWEIKLTTDWRITPQKVDAAIERILQLSRPRKLVIFGSYIRGEIRSDSDVDILVVTGDEIENARKESVRIRRSLRGISMPMDILVVQESRLRELAEAPGMIYREALRNGRVVYESSP